MRERRCYQTKTFTYKSLTFLCLCALVSLPSIGQAAPGGASTSLQLWLKADAGTGATSTGDVVTNWLDSWTTVTSLDGINSPTYVASYSNYNPAILYLLNAQHKLPMSAPAIPILNSAVFLAGTPTMAS